MPHKNEIRLFAYKLSHDTGFAPNPFHGVCTLATCKPQIRLRKRVGDWVAGFASLKLNDDKVGSERLIYLMRVDERLLLESYYLDHRFAAKIPVKDSPHCIDTMGDNIYGLRDGVFFQIPNRNHTEKQLLKDTSGRFVLIGKTFAYFGSEPLKIPVELRPIVPIGQSAHGVCTEDPIRAQAFIDFVLAQGTGIHARPTSWKSDDTTWRRIESCG